MNNFHVFWFSFNVLFAMKIIVFVCNAVKVVLGFHKEIFLASKY